MDTESSDDSSSEYSSESSDDGDDMEIADINGTRLQLPQGLCEQKDIFQHIFTTDTWNSLTETSRQHLETFLPNFPENDDEEKAKTLQKLFNFDEFRFYSPLEKFHENLKAGYYRPDITNMRNIIKKAEYKESKYRYKKYREKLKINVIESQKKLIGQISNLPPGIEPKNDRIYANNIDYIAHRTKRRYFQVLTAIQAKVESNYCSSDENYPDGPPPTLSRKLRRHLNSIKNSFTSNNERIFYSTMSKQSNFNLDKYITPFKNPFNISDDNYKCLILNHKKRKLENPNDPEFNTKNLTITDIVNRTQLPYIKNLPNKQNIDNKILKKKIKKELITTITNLQSSDLYTTTTTTTKTNINTSNSDIESDSDSYDIQNKKLKLCKTKIKSKNKLIDLKKDLTIPIKSIQTITLPIIQKSPSTQLTKLKSTPLTPTAPSQLPLSSSSLLPPVSIPTATIKSTSRSLTTPIKLDKTSTLDNVKNNFNYDKITPVTLTDLDGIDMMSIPIDLENSDIDIIDLNNKPELMQETHSNFLSLIRDIICSTNEHRMSYNMLQERLKSWQENPISPLNDWYSLTDNWVTLLKQTMNFLCGNTTEQPDDFVPYIEYKPSLDMYQWIGAGRDSDNLLSQLCQYWLEHKTDSKLNKDKDDMDIEVSDRSQTPPPPRCPTNWLVRKATIDEIKDFREQERKRYDNPHKAFTYRCNGYESVVGPLKGIYNPSVGNTKARGHTMLSADRPNFVTILSLVRDATARLPNGEGTRADICELLKSSQYISSTAPENVLQSVVSGALDRMHTQFDPCVKYDSKRKIWIYLHRNRTEEDFERIHQQYQGVNKTKKINKRKIRVKTDKSNKKNENNQISLDRTKIKTKPSQITVISPITNSTTTTTTNSTSLLINNNLNNNDLQNKKSSDDNDLLQQSLNKILTSKQQLSKGKSLVKIITPNQGKSLIIPSNSQQVFKQITEQQQQQRNNTTTSNKQLNQQIVTQHLLQTITNKQNKNQTIQIIQQKSNNDNKIDGKSSTTSSSSSLSSSTTTSQSLIQNITNQHLQNLKNVTLVRGVTSSGGTVNVNLDGKLNTLSDRNIQIKTQTSLTPIQQQQILQTIKHKILPQATVLNPQQIILKQKTIGKQNQNNSTGGTSILVPPSTKINTELKTTGITTQNPVVAKVLTNAAGQVISVESLIAHQKQHGSLPQGTTLRVSGTKGGTTNIIQLTNTSKSNTVQQFAVASQNNIIALTTQPKLVVATQSVTSSSSPSSSSSSSSSSASTSSSTSLPATTTVAILQTSTLTTTTTTTGTIATSTLTKSITRTLNKGQSLTKFTPKVAQQLLNAKLLTQKFDGQKIVQPKIIMGQQNHHIKLTGTNKNISLAKPVTLNVTNATNLNLTHIGGKPVILASKGNTIQNLQGQNVILQQTGTNTNSSIVLQNAVVKTSQQQQQQQQNVVLGSPIKMQTPQQVVFSTNVTKSTTNSGGGGGGAGGVGVNVSGVNTQSHIVLEGHPVRLQTTQATNSQRVVLASQGQGGQILTQQILLPAGFQGTAINIKALQGVKVIPLAQATGQGKGIQGRQVFARLMNPSLVKTVTSPSSEKLSESIITTTDS